MSESYGADPINVTVQDDVAVIQLSRPEKLNAVTLSMLEKLASVIEEYGDGSRARGLVLTGAGRAFSAGHDLSAANQAETATEMKESVEAFHEVSKACLKTRVPTIAALNGVAVGGAFEMTLAFDRRMGGRNAGVYMPENSLGLVVSNASSLFLSQLLPRGAVMDFVLGSRRYTSSEARELGLIDEIVEDDLVAASIQRIHEYTPDNSSSPQHLGLFRPSLEDVERAMSYETAAAVDAWKSGVTEKGNKAFWARNEWR